MKENNEIKKRKYNEIKITREKTAKELDPKLILQTLFYSFRKGKKRGPVVASFWDKLRRQAISFVFMVPKGKR